MIHFCFPEILFYFCHYNITQTHQSSTDYHPVKKYFVSRWSKASGRHIILASSQLVVEGGGNQTVAKIPLSITKSLFWRPVSLISIFFQFWKWHVFCLFKIAFLKVYQGFFPTELSSNVMVTQTLRKIVLLAKLLSSAVPAPRVFTDLEYHFIYDIYFLENS